MAHFLVYWGTYFSPQIWRRVDRPADRRSGLPTARWLPRALGAAHLCSASSPRSTASSERQRRWPRRVRILGRGGRREVARPEARHVQGGAPRRRHRAGDQPSRRRPRRARLPRLVRLHRRDRGPARGNQPRGHPARGDALRGGPVPRLQPGPARRTGRPDGPADLDRWPLLYDLGWDADWSYWFARQGRPSPDLSRASGFRLYSMVVQAASNGLGIAIGRPMLIAHELESRTLVPVFDTQAEAPERCCLIITTAAARQRPEVQAFREWVLRGRRRQRSPWLTRLRSAARRPWRGRQPGSPGESPGGIAPPGARRTVRERLRSYSSHHPAAGVSPSRCQWANSRGSRRARPPSQ